MMQSKVRVKLEDEKFDETFDKGSYPQPRSEVTNGIEVFKVRGNKM